jgi:glutamate 5-kinase
VGLLRTATCGSGSTGSSATVLKLVEPARFASGDRSDSAFKLWLRFGKPVAGRLHVDDGARRAVFETGASLLGVGIVRCEGRFDPGAAVELVGPDGEVFGKGIAGAAAEEVAGRRRGLEVVHRDKLVLY